MRQSDFYVAALDACCIIKITGNSRVKQTGHKQQKGRQLINKLKMFTPLASGTNNKKEENILSSLNFKYISTGCV